MKRAILFVAVLVSLIAVSPAADAATLYEQLSGKSVKIYIAPPTDTSANKKADLAGMKTELEKALAERKSIRFEIVDTAEAADYAVLTDVQEFYWTANDPIDMIAGLGMTAMDAAKNQNYARLQALFTIQDVKKGSQEVWRDKLLATVTKDAMDEASSVPLVNEDIANAFVKSAFGKKAKK